MHEEKKKMTSTLGSFYQYILWVVETCLGFFKRLFDRLKSKPKDFLDINDVPGPWPSLPFIGTSWQYLPGGRYKLFDLHESCADKFRRFGPIVREEFEWGHPSIHLFNPDDFERVFRSQGRHPRRPVQEFLVHYRRTKPELYDSAGLANEEGEAWAKLRREVGPVLLKPRSLHFLMPPLNEALDDWVTLLRSHRDPHTCKVNSFQDYAYRFALEGVYLLSLDCRLGCLEPEMTEDATDMISAVRLMFEAFQELYYAPPLWKWFETPAYAKLARAESLLYKASSRRIREMVSALREGDEVHCGVLRNLLQTEKLSDRELIVTVIDLIAGGIFTVANSLAFLIYHVARNRDVQQRLYRELEEVMPDSGISSERLSRMPYVRACVKEAFRLTPTIPCITRILSEDTELSGYKIPAGTTVFCNFPVPCLQPDIFPDPERFSPERWLDTKNSPNPFTLVPFGFGARMCVGKTFAEMEMYAALVKLVYHFELEYEGPDVESKSAFILVPSNPVSVVLKDR